MAVVFPIATSTARTSSTPTIRTTRANINTQSYFGSCVATSITYIFSIFIRVTTSTQFYVSPKPTTITWIFSISNVVTAKSQASFICTFVFISTNFS